MLWFKAFHIIAVVCWFAMLFYLPRLFVYHAMASDEISLERFKIMERKLYFGIGTPAMLASIILGFATMHYGLEYYLTSSWFWIKMVLVAILVAYHVACGVHMFSLKANNNTRSHVYFRWFNEFPVLLLIVIVLLVVLKQPI